MLKRLLILSILLLISLSFAPLSFAQGTAQLRVVHAVADAPAVDIAINGVVVAQGVSYGDATLHFTVPAGENNVAVQTTDGSPVHTQAVLVDENFAFSVVLAGSAASIDGLVYEDNLDPLNLGEIRLTAIHAVQGASVVDVTRASGAPLMTPVAYGQPYGTINLPAGVYDLQAVPNGGGDAIANTGAVNMISNGLYSVLIAPDQMLVLSDAVKPSADQTYIRLGHGVADADAVDLYIDEVLVARNVSFGDVTPHVAFPSGDHELALRAADTPANSDALFTTTLTVGDSPQTFIVLPDGDSLTVGVFDDAADVSADVARVQILNLADEDISLDIGSESATADAGSMGDTLDLAPDVYEIAGEEEPLYGGVLYSLVVFDAETATTTETPLAVELTSSPFAGAIVAEAEGETVAEVEPTVPPVEPPSDTAAIQPTAPPAPDATAVQPTAPPAPDAAVAPTVPPVAQQPPPPAQPTAPPPQAEQPQQQFPGVQPNAQPTRPGIYPPVDVIFGNVNLNRGANLQCREYPSTTARSLGLIPNNTELVIQGIYGPRDETGDVGRTDAILIEGIPDLTELATEDVTVGDITAAELETLDPEQFWLNVDWILEDGTVFGCWSGAPFIYVTLDNQFVNETLEYLQLIDNRNIDVIPYNVPGGPRDPDTSVDPSVLSQPTPQGPESIVATVNVNRGVNLQLRRTPGVDGESLSLVPGGAQLTVLGQTALPVSGNVGEPSIPEWLYIEYLQPDNIRVRGWISAEFVILTLAGRLYELADVPEVETVETGGYVVDDDVIVDEPPAAAPPAGQGAQDGGAAPAAPPSNAVTAILLTDPGTQTNLRDRPAVEGTVRSTMPSGAILTVLGRSVDSQWVEVVFESNTGGVQGWVSASFLRVTFQGQDYDVNQLSVTEPQ